MEFFIDIILYFFDMGVNWRTSATYCNVGIVYNVAFLSGI